ncbi:MAG: TonB-dependent receptor plug domain-containing protein [Candidatus Riflebacteria bacterium]|nr:TonB-dependent receptor plug domain-containing protein [Candidatus Riflebacteria bacterium]
MTARKTVLLILLISFCRVCFSAEPSRLRKLSLEELLELEVVPVLSSVSRRSEKVTQIPASVYVITGEDIRRSGASCIPEALRLAPGLNVSRIDGSKWAISVRGSNTRFFGNLLVMIDGRSVYSPLFSGVYWDVQDTPVADIERIEVVRGPGGTTWGANAVNGVINIVTKSSHSTRGGLVSAGAGTANGSDFLYRYGSDLDGKGSFRFFIKDFQRNTFRSHGTNERIDDYNQSRFGIRFDLDPSESRKITLDANVYSGLSHEMTEDPPKPGSMDMPKYNSSRIGVSGGNLRFLIQKIQKPGKELKLQFYFDRTQRSESKYDETIDTFDLDMQQQISSWKRQELTWGLAYRSIKYNISSHHIKSAPKDSINIPSFFIQDQISLKPDKLFLTLGGKVYDHPYVGTELQPSARLLWKPFRKHVFWTSWTEARRVPSIFEREGGLAGEGRNSKENSTITGENVGNDSLQSEVMKAKELGYRFLPDSKLSLDLSLFRQDYFGVLRNVEKSQENNISTNPTQLIVTTNMGNLSVEGAELSVEWKAFKSFRISAGQSINWQVDTSSIFSDTISPSQWFLRTYWDMKNNMELDFSFQHSNQSDSNSDMNNLLLPAIDSLNAHFGWHPNKYFELSAGGQHLLKPWHTEFSMQRQYLSSDIPRNYYIKATWFF